MAPGFRQRAVAVRPIVLPSNAARRRRDDGDDMDDPNTDTLLTGSEAADVLRLSERTMERHRVTGTGPRFVRLGRSIRYRRQDLIDHLDRHVHRSTSEPGPAAVGD